MNNKGMFSLMFILGALVVSIAALYVVAKTDVIPTKDQPKIVTQTEQKVDNIVTDVKSVLNLQSKCTVQFENTADWDNTALVMDGKWDTFAIPNKFTEIHFICDKPSKYKKAVWHTKVDSGVDSANNRYEVTDVRLDLPAECYASDKLELIFKIGKPRNSGSPEGAKIWSCGRTNDYPVEFKIWRARSVNIAKVHGFYESEVIWE